MLALPVQAADREFSLEVDGRTRSYLVHVPPRASHGRPLPLVVLLHGGGGNARQAARSYRMNQVSDREQFLVAYPNGTGRFENALLTWNAGNCCSYAMEQRVDDVAFIRAMVEQIDRDFGIDRARIYATGMSNGAMMAYRLGCEAADLFAAIAPVAGALNISCRPSDEVSVAIFNGTDDQHVPYRGGTGAKAREERVDRPVSHAVNVWVNANGCSPRPVRSRTGSIAIDTWSPCREGTAVTLYTIVGGGHAWPGGEPSRRREADRPTQEISASVEMWDFFENHPKR
jgi:polyhydroxybutyrate depolymerase